MRTTLLTARVDDKHDTYPSLEAFLSRQVVTPCCSVDLLEGVPSSVPLSDPLPTLVCLLVTLLM